MKSLNAWREAVGSLVARAAISLRVVAEALGSGPPTSQVPPPFILSAKFWLERVDDFELLMMLFFGAIVRAFPIAVSLARRHEKSRLFAVGAVVRALASCFVWTIQPDRPRWTLFVAVPSSHWVSPS